MDWDDPAERSALIERVGPQEYNRQFAEHRKSSVISTVAGHEIRPVGSRFGRLFAVGGTDRAFATQKEAEQYAKDNPVA